ncbi:MAG TPA: 2Fe-2S iron-sulfur cluster-binding protein, partial [Candidatus Acidoferrales bacterium]|nr:2Fe-2S iron-sulfur cluster-binding protein [Candidatus Acidoferrales bacterium]
MSRERGRLGAPFGRSIDRARPITFRFEGEAYTGFAGDTVASALWANDVRVLSRSFKYKRPRGIFSLTGFDGGLLVQAGDEPNRPADRLALTPDLPPISAQNYFGSLAYDLSAWTGLCSRFLPVGFYYRAFFRPKGAWRFFEPIIRRSGGLGRVLGDRAQTHAPQTDKQYLFCDVAVVGAGPAGLAAAAAAAQRGEEVLLIEAAPEIGGSLRYCAADQVPVQDLLAEVQAAPNIRILTAALAQGLYADNWLAVEAAQRLYKVRAGRVIVATGGYEQPLIFRNNDLPGVMLASAARRLMWTYGVAPGRRAVVCTANDEGLGAALDLVEAGVEVATVADLRSAAHCGPLHDRLAGRNVPILMQTSVYEALREPRPTGWYFGSPLHAVRLAQFGSSSPAAGALIACDVLCVSGGFTPAAALLCHAGAKLRYDEQQQALVLRDLPRGVEAAGAVRGLRTLDAVLADGAAAARGTPRPEVPPADGALQTVIPHPRGKEFVDFDEDLTIKEIHQALDDGFTHTELLKRYSATGMGPSQGKFSALASTRVASEHLGIGGAAFGTTTTRPPVTGVPFRLLAGKGFSPYRLTPMHARHLELGAQMMVAGAWYRPAYYGTPAEREAAIQREALAVRTAVGLIDVSTLGGIELSGPDAAAFIDRVYATPHAKQPVGRTRYALLCEDGGAIVDDGVACRLGENRFYVTATTGAVDQTYRKLLWLNVQWRMDVDILNVTSAFAAVNIAGPRAREVLTKLTADVDLSAQAFPYLAMRVGTIEGIPARLLRVGFVGELGYEIHVPMSQGLALWDALMRAGAQAGIVPFGVEAQRLLRLEKGHVIVGQDTDGLTHPYEAQLDWAVSKTKHEYVGKPAVDAQFAMGLQRRLVGFVPTDATVSPPPECCLVVRDGAITGRVTSSARSEACGSTVGLAYVA